MPSGRGAASGAKRGATIGTAIAPGIGTAIGAGLGALGGAFGGPSMTREQRRALEYWNRRVRDQENLATQEFSGYVDPETGEWVPGSRYRAERGYEDILAAPGYTGEEQSGLYLTPEQEASYYLSPEEQAEIRLTPEYRERMRSAVVEPIAGSVNRATEMLTRAAGARGNYGGGYGANIQRIAAEGGRQGSSAVARTNLDLADLDREAALWLAQHRTGTARDVAGSRIGATREIGQARMGQQEFGTTGRAWLSSQDLSRMMGYGGYGGNMALQAPQQESPWARAVSGAATGAAPWLAQWGSRRRTPRGSDVSVDPRPSDFPINRQPWS